MTLHEAMANLGYNSSEHFKKMMALSRTQQMEMAQSFMEEAKFRAKKLMAKHHPDRGGDQEKFIRVTNSMDTIEAETKHFLSAIKAKIEADAERRANQVLISIG